MMLMNESEWEIVHIPKKPHIPTHQQPTVDVYAAIVDPKHANTLVRKLNQIAPLENLHHVKRARKRFLEGGKSQLSVILCLACGNGSLLDGIPNDVLELINLYQLSAFITKVCRYAALSKEEWEEQCKLWPTSYHPPTYNIDGITGFSVGDSHSIVNFMNLAVRMAKSGDGQLVNAAIIVDPSTKELIARACDQTHIPQPMIGQTGAETCFLKEQEAYTSDPLAGREESHEILLPNSSLDEPRQLYTGVACLSPRRWAEKQLHTCLRHPLGHAAIVAIEHSAARDRRLFPAIGHAGGDSAQIDHTVSSLTASSAKRQRTNLKDVEDGEKVHSHTNGFHSELVRPYLCTGYDIFLVWEPCTMCSMALVHQRIRRIFYAFPNPNEGALGSVHRLQGEKSLNHHYAVFRVVLPAKILEAGGSIVSNSCEDDNKTT